MTYAASQISYWVGQANDASTGTHPTGWTINQRWSETAGEWQTMYNTEYSGARDTSAGQPGKPSGTAHPTGWVNNQLWSDTATQWNTMWGLEWTAARDTSAGQPGKPSGTQHPTGWVSAQLWSVTATQWNTMWGTEWNNARDPQGFSYSYPGQAANAVLWSQSANYWRGQADYYWGPSRVWNNGNTWETLYNNYVGYYNDMVSQRDTWTSRANQAWGPSRTWNSGDSWETKWNARDNIRDISYSYASATGCAGWVSAGPNGAGHDNPATPDAAGYPPTNWAPITWGAPTSNRDVMISGNNVYAPTAGYYTAVVLMQTAGGLGVRIHGAAENVVPSGASTTLGTTWIQCQFGNAQYYGTGWYWFGYLPAGATFHIDSWTYYATPTVCTLYVTFHPSRPYPGI